MDSTSAALSLPQFGTFDEETCRYFLRAVGEQIVPFYPFTVGIDEVYTLLLQQYGEDRVADALSVLHELMEAEDNANGLGDDGDIWRSWRHSWRHRNDGPSQPFVPTVRDFVLPPPTSQKIRRARAASFSAWIATPQEATGDPIGPSRNTLSTEPEKDETLPQSTFTDDCKSSADKEEADSQQDFEEVRQFAKSIDFDNSQLISFEMLTPPSGLRGGDMEIRILRPIRTMQTREGSPLSVKHQKRISQSTSCQSANANMVRPATVSKRETNAGYHGAIQRPPEHTKFETNCPVEPTTRRTASNRHARLIDGAIFTGKHRGLMDPITRPGDKLYDRESKKSLVRASWSALRQKEPSRHSLISRIFGKDQLPQQQQYREDLNKSHRRTSSFPHDALDSGCDMVFPDPTLTSTSPSPPITPHVQTRSWGLDGAFDEELGLPRASLNLNKALPASPGYSGVRKASSSRTGTASIDQSQDTPIRPSTASSVSSGISTVSNKQDFRALTRALINEDMSARRPDLSPVREAETLPPLKYEPRKSMQSSIYSENSHKGTKNDPVPLTPGIPLPLSVRKNEKVTTSLEAPRLSPSQSMPDVQTYTPSKAQPEAPTYRSPAPSRYNVNTHEVKLEAESTARGRTPHRPPTPSHTAHRPTTPDLNTQRRSRSPVKKILGHFGKSTSLKNIASEPRSKSNSASPEKSATTPLKSWGNRFRHGFLTTDSETEPPEDASTPFRKVTPSTPQQSTFPISLDPPYQAKILSEIELMICHTANHFLMEQFNGGRLSDDSIIRIKQHWAAKNRPQVLQFMYDQATQRDLIALNLNKVQFYGECAQNAQVLNATLYNWKSMASEMAVRTFCSADSAVRKYMHDSHKIIEMLGAHATTFFALQDLQVRTLAKITEKQRERVERNKEQETPSKKSRSVGRRVGTPAPIFGHTPKGSIELNPSPGFGEAYETFENSRGGRLGMMVRDMAKDGQH